jgi:hypothetical protein
MDAGWALILAAIVTAVGAIIVAVLDKFRKENSQDHEVVMGMLKIMHKSQQRTEDKVDKVDERLSDHLQFHAEKEKGGKHGGAKQR